MDQCLAFLSGAIKGGVATQIKGAPLGYQVLFLDGGRALYDVLLGHPSTAIFADEVESACERLQVEPSATAHHETWTGVVLLKTPRGIGLATLLEHPSAGLIARGAKGSHAASCGTGFVHPLIAMLALVQDAPLHGPNYAGAGLFPPDSLKLLDSGSSSRGGESLNNRVGYNAMLFACMHR